MLKKTLKAIIISTFLLASCRTPTQSGNDISFTKKSFPPLTEQDTKIASDSKLITANNKFALKVFDEIFKGEKTKNIFISPLSISFALSMTYNGADGKTKEGMEKALELSNLSIVDLNKESNLLMRTLINADPAVKLDIANSLWGKKGVQFNPTFISSNQEFFKAEVTDLDFSQKTSLDKINSWVSNNTQKRIEKIMDSIDPDTLLILINAIYFKGDWTNKFDKELTKDMDFTLADDKKVKASMMSQNDDFKYYKGDNFQAVSLPYGNESISMYTFLPDKDSNLEELEKVLADNEKVKTVFSSFKKKKGQVVMPKFKLEYEKKLNDVLKKLGMEEAFAESANFKKMFAKDTPAMISEVKHKTFVEVNETGTEAAAVTSVGVVATSVMIPQEPFKMIMDRPFFYLIRDNTTGSILFMGSLNNPK